MADCLYGIKPLDKCCYAQDSVKVKMICFEYDDSGSVVMEAFCNEEKEADVALNILINAMVRVRKDM